MTPQGFLFVDKPIGPTSHDVVAHVRRVLSVGSGKVKVGHAGTLDPLASGLLILGIGSATKALGLLVGLPKRYQCSIRLGATTITDDSEALPEPTEGAHAPGKHEIDQVLQHFIGKQEQRPPVFSAKKQQGTPLYKLARAGKNVEPKNHWISITELSCVNFAYPKLDIDVACSSGTYIRSLARDIGESLKTGGYVQKLRRTVIGPFEVTASVPYEQLTFETIMKNLITPENVLIIANKAK
ncbi:MAG: tRNA pseudouridine(55) synthase TruB [Patescibacteria group bacterium]|jgi:tRNA pseudouridine55 synthase